MINLLPDKDKSELIAARHNVLLVRYITISLIAILALYAVMKNSEQLLVATKTSAEATIASNTTEAGVYSQTKQRVGELSNNLTTAQSILDKEVHFSKILTNIASQMPEGTIIGELNLSTASLQGPVSITAYGKTTDAILALQSAFRSSSLFSSVAFQSVSGSGSGVAGYPVSVTMNVTFSKTAGQ